MEATGINLSAFGTTQKPVIAHVTLHDGEAAIKLRDAGPLAERARLADDTATVFAGWRQELLGLARPIGVDVALDVSALKPVATGPLWGMTHRPLDYAFYGDAPVTDRIGEFGVRFRAMLDAGSMELGKELIEASPRATLELLEFKGQYAGGSAHHTHAGWRADDRGKRPDKLLAKMLQELGINAGEGTQKLGSTELDAILCAMTALAVRKGEGNLTARELDGEISERCARRSLAVQADRTHKAPRHAFVLARPFWESAVVTRE
jgi:hypothetical protein